MRLIAVLLLTGFIAVLGLSAPAQAHGSGGGHAMSHVMADCPECPLVGADADGAGHVSQDCPHVTGCGAMVLTEGASALPALLPVPVRHDRPPHARLEGRYGRIDLPPPRVCA